MSNENHQWVISQLLYDIIKRFDGTHSVEDIARELKQIYGCKISEQHISYVADKMLKKNGLLYGYEMEEERKNRSRNKKLWVKKSIISSKSINKFRIFTCLFHPKYFKKLLIFFSLLQIGIAAYLLLNIKLLNLNIYQNMGVQDFIGMIILLLTATFFHELGHASATMSNGLISGDIGFGIYYIMPVLYTDVSQIWKLNKTERLKVDVGGIYFNMIYNAIIFIIFSIFHDTRFLLILFLFVGQILMTLNPFLKMDGYWCFTDFIGVPNLHKVVKKVLLDFIKKIFHIKTKSLSYNLRKKEKKYIYIYSSICLLFYIFFYGWLLFMAVKAITNINLLVSKIIQVLTYPNSLSEKITMLIKVLNDDLLYYIVIILLIRYVIIGIVKLRKYIIKRR